MLVCVFANNNCTRDRGCSAHPVFPAPSCFLGVEIEARLGRIAPRGRKVVSGSTCLKTSLRVLYQRQGWYQIRNDGSPTTAPCDTPDWPGSPPPNRDRARSAAGS